MSYILCHFWYYFRYWCFVALSQIGPLKMKQTKKLKEIPFRQVLDNPMTMLIIFLLQTIPLIENPPEKASIYAIIYLKLIG